MTFSSLARAFWIETPLGKAVLDEQGESSFRWGAQYIQNSMDKPFAGQHDPTHGAEPGLRERNKPLGNNFPYLPASVSALKPSQRTSLLDPT